MPLIDRDIHQAKALIIDANATARSVMAAQLRDLGVHQVRQISRVQDARLVLEESPHDIVLCEMSFEGVLMSGQDLLDELRREHLLPYNTAFILVTGEASYAQVMEAAEATVDGYLVKPCSGAVLGERLSEVRRRKRALKAIYEAVQSGDVARAAAMAQARFESRESYWSFAGQVAAELWLRADQPQRALAIYQAVIDSKPQGWAKAGVARVRLAAGELAAARRHLDKLVAEMPGYADAHDLLGRVAVEQGDFEAAAEAFRAAARLSPGCLLRLQHAGALAFYRGCTDEAAQHIEKTISLGRKSKLFDLFSLALLGLLKFDQRDSRGLASVLDQVTAAAAGDTVAAPVRLERMRRVLATLAAVLARKPEQAMELARGLAADAAGADFDLEAATLCIATWMRLPSAEVQPKELDALLRQLGLRFCISKAATEMLAASAAAQPGSAETLRNCHAVISNMAEQALNKSLAGEAPAAIEMLLQQGEHTRNAKLVEMAGAVARRNAKQLPDVEAVQARVRTMQDAWCAPLTHIAGVRRSARMPGGVVLRT